MSVGQEGAHLHKHIHTYTNTHTQACTRTRTHTQEREIDRLERDPDGDVAHEALMLERDRLRWLVKAYLRTRLAKVQQYAGAARRRAARRPGPAAAAEQGEGGTRRGEHAGRRPACGGLRGPGSRRLGLAGVGQHGCLLSCRSLLLTPTHMLMYTHAHARAHAHAHKHIHTHAPAAAQPWC